MASAVHTHTHAPAPWANATAQVVLVDVGATVGRLSTRQCVLVSRGLAKRQVHTAMDR